MELKIDEGLAALLETGKRKGYLTYAQVNDYLPDDAVNPEKLDQLPKIFPHTEFKIMHKPVNEGKGAALRDGFKLAGGDCILIQDADLEYDPEDWPRLLAPILKGRAQVVYGSRYRGERETSSIRHYVADRSLALFASLLFNTAISDIQTCFKVFDRDVVDSMTIESDGFDLEPELTAKLLRARHKIYEVPVSFSGRTEDEGRKFTWRDQLEAMRTLVKYRVRR